MHKSLLIITQKIDRNDPILGFFHDWVVALAAHRERVSVICLEKGEYSLPSNVSVYSLGKEGGRSRTKYLLRFFRYLFILRKQYKNVFVHMNEEYVLLGGLLWRLFGKRVGLWRNHKQGNWRTRVAVALSNVVFFTSPDSFTARFKKAVQMPVGIDTERFSPETTEKKKDTVLYVGRVSRVKNIECLIDAIALLNKRGEHYSLDIFGPVLDSTYLEFLKNRIREHDIAERVVFRGVVSPKELPDVYRKYAICVNMTSSGSFDKTIFEGMSCGLPTICSHKSLKNIIPNSCIFEENNHKDLAHKIEHLFLADSTERGLVGIDLRKYVVSEHSLKTLLGCLSKEI